MNIPVLSKAARPVRLAHFAGAGLGTLLRLGVLSTAVATVALIQIVSNPVPAGELTVSALAPIVEEPMAQAPAQETNPAAGNKDLTITPESALNPDEVRNSNWFSRAQTYVESIQYEVFKRPAGQFGALNKGVEIEFNHGDVRFSVSRGALEGDATPHRDEKFSFAWRTLDVGRDEARAKVHGATLDGQFARVVYDRFGVIEYYDNKNDGVEQSFVIKDRPQGGGEVVLRGKFESENLLPVMDEGAKTIHFYASTGLGAGGVVFAYSNLIVFDANRNVLPSRMSLDNGVVSLAYDDSGAAYPVTIDPLTNVVEDWQVVGLTAEHPSFPGTTMALRFGTSMAGGDFNNDGVGDIAVGMPGRDHATGILDSGGFLVWYGRKHATHSGSGFVSLSTVPDAFYYENAANGSYAFMGMNMISADLDGDGCTDLIVSAPGHGNGGQYRGKIYIFYGATGAAGQGLPGGFPKAVGDQIAAPYTTISGTVTNQAIGLSMCVGQFATTNSPRLDLAFSGANDSSLPASSGKVWVFYSNASGRFSSQGADLSPGSANWTASDGGAGVGIGLGMSDPNYPAATSPFKVRPHQALAAGNIDGNGSGLDALIMGAFAGSDTANGRGAVYIMQGTANGFGTSTTTLRSAGVATWKIESNDSAHNGNRFGAAVATGDFNLDGRADILVGAPGGNGGLSMEGLVYMWFGSAASGPVSGGGAAWQLNPSSNQVWLARGNNSNAGVSTSGFSTNVNEGFGRCIAVGDVNGDGRPDVLVSGNLHMFGSGSAFLWYGSATNGINGGTTGLGVNGTNATTTNSEWVFTGQGGVRTLPTASSGGDFGNFVAITRSMDSDNQRDILIGMQGNTSGGQGMARIYTTGWRFYFEPASDYVPATGNFVNEVASLPINEGSGGGTTVINLMGGAGILNSRLRALPHGTSAAVNPPAGTRVRWRTVSGTAVATGTAPGQPDYNGVSDGIEDWTGYFEWNGTSEYATIASPATITIHADNVDEEDNEYFYIEIAYPTTGRAGVGLQTASPSTQMAGRRFRVNIQDDDDPPTAYLIDAPGGNQSNEVSFLDFPETGPPQQPIHIYLSNPSGRNAQLQWATIETPLPMPTPYAKNNFDFVAQNGTMTILLGSPTPQHGSFDTITILPDVIYEYNETFELRITGTDSCYISGFPGPGNVRTYTVTIMDDDEPPVACFALGSYTVIEGNINQTVFPVVISLRDPVTGVPRHCERGVEIRYFTQVLGTGIDVQPLAAEDQFMVPLYGLAADFLPVTAGVVQFNYDGSFGTAPGDITQITVTTKQVFLAVVADTIYEVDEEFLIVIDELASSNIKVDPLIGPDVTTVTIQDDDLPPEVQFSTGNINVDEANVLVTVTVNLSVAHERWVQQPDPPIGSGAITGNMVSVNYRANTGTATGGPGPTQGTNEDYITINPTLLQLTWLQTSFTFSVQIWDDDISEATETIDLALTGGVSVLMGTITTATISIIDNDGQNTPFVYFDVPSVSVAETAGNAIVDIKLSVASGQAVRVQCATADGTAVAPGDYTHQSLQVTFNPGQMTRSFVVPIIDDDIRETTEYLVLTLTSPIAANLGNPSSMIINLLDNEPDPVVQFKRAVYGVSEAGIAATINVVLDIECALPVTVQYFTSPGTASPDFDYNDVAGTLTFPAGSTEQIFTVPILNDTLIESDETVILTLANPINAIMGPLNTATLTIVDDESGAPSGGGGVVTGGGCSTGHTTSTGIISLFAVLTLLGVLRFTRRRKA